MAKVEFDPQHFKTYFPHAWSSKFTAPVLLMLWDTAVQFVGDDDSNSPYPYDPERCEFKRRNLLYLALAHIAQMYLRDVDNLNSGLAGRITSASEGSVNVSVETYKADSLQAQWWSQTFDGQRFWMLTQWTRGPRMYISKDPHPHG